MASQCNLAAAPTLNRFNSRVGSSSRGPMLLRTRNGVKIGSSSGFLNLSNDARIWSKEEIPWGAAPQRHHPVIAASGKIAPVSQTRPSRILVLLSLCALVHVAFLFFFNGRLATTLTERNLTGVEDMEISGHGAL